MILEDVTTKNRRNNTMGEIIYISDILEAYEEYKQNK